MELDITLKDMLGNPINSVSKGQPVKATVTVTKLADPANNNVVVTVDTSNYAYIGNPVYTGFGGQIPSVDTTTIPGKVIFNFANPLTAGQDGTITFDAVKTCNNYDLSATLNYDDNCGGHCSDSATATPALKLQGDLDLKFTPDQYQITDSNLSWKIYVTNKGAGTAYNVNLLDSLKNIFTYQSSTIDGVLASPTQTINGSYNDVAWDLGDMIPNQVKTVVVNAATNGSGCDYGAANSVRTSYGWNLSGTYTECAFDWEPSAPVFTEIPSAMTLRNEVDPATLCEDTKIRLTVINSGQTYDYNIKLIQKLNNTGFIYKPGTTQLIKVNDSPITPVNVNDPIISGPKSDILTWTYVAGTNYLANLLQLAPGESFTIQFEVQTNDDITTQANRLIESKADWQKPCQKGGSVYQPTARGIQSSGLVT